MTYKKGRSLGTGSEISRRCDRKLAPFVAAARLVRTMTCWPGLLLCSAASVSSQAPVAQIGSEPACKSCTLELSPVVRLGGGTTDPVGFGPTAQVAVSNAGHYAVSSSTFHGEIQIYSSAGAWVRSLGREGGGPGEFRGELLLVYDAQDSLHVVEQGGVRYTVFGPDLVYVRSARFAGQVVGFCLEAAGTLFTIGSRMEGNRVSVAQVFARSGESLASFASFSLDSLDPRTIPQVLACGIHGERWVAGRAAYFVERWGLDGQLERHFEATREWFPTARVATSRSGAGVAPRRRPGGSVGPSTQIVGLSVDLRSRIWVFASVPDERWKDAGTDPIRNTDTIVEVIDGANGILLARSRFDEVLMPLGPTRAYSMVENDVGDREIQIWVVSLSESGRRSQSRF